LLFERFFRERKPNTDAIADLALENFIEMRDRVADPRFLLEREVEKILQNRFPDEYISRYGLVTFSRVPYQFAKEAGLIENEILSELCASLDRAADVDLKRAERLIRDKLAQRLKEARRG
jgi:kynurenine 3-monooxygenase